MVLSTCIVDAVHKIHNPFSLKQDRDFVVFALKDTGRRRWKGFFFNRYLENKCDMICAWKCNFPTWQTDRPTTDQPTNKRGSWGIKLTISAKKYSNFFLIVHTCHHHCVRLSSCTYASIFNFFECFQKRPKSFRTSLIKWYVLRQKRHISFPYYLIYWK